MKGRWLLNLAAALAVTAVLLAATALAVTGFMRLSSWVSSFRHGTAAIVVGCVVVLALAWFLGRRSRRQRRESRQVARAIVDDRLHRLKVLPYAALLHRHGTTAHECVAGADGREYQVETSIVWDSAKRRDNLRIMVSVDGGAVAALRPLAGDFIIAPDGSFIGE